MTFSFPVTSYVYDQGQAQAQAQAQGLASRGGRIELLVTGSSYLYEEELRSEIDVTDQEQSR